MSKSINHAFLVACVTFVGSPVVGAGDSASVVLFEESDAADGDGAVGRPALSRGRDANAGGDDGAVGRPATSRQNPAAPLGSESKRPPDNRYRYQSGRWWYLSRDNQWLVWNGTRWMPYRGQTGQAGGPVARANFDTWFNAYRTVQAGGAPLQTAEQGEVEMATDEITDAESTGEGFNAGAIPPSQARRQHAGIHAGASGMGAWFNNGSPFGIKYGYGSGYGYGGYGFNNPYGYGPRTGGGGAYGYGFGAFGSVGGQTGERLSGLITGGAGAEPGRLISSEPSSIGAPSQLERGAVGGTFTRSGAGARSLGGSAAEGSGD